MAVIDIQKYIKALPLYHKHKQGYVVEIYKYEDEKFYGRFYNYTSGKIIENTATMSEHLHYLNSDTLTIIKDNIELAKVLLDFK
jgi:hypothetical protein